MTCTIWGIPLCFIENEGANCHHKVFTVLVSIALSLNHRFVTSASTKSKTPMLVPKPKAAPGQVLGLLKLWS